MMADAEQEPLSCGQFCAGIGKSLRERTAKDWAFALLRFVALAACLYLFLFALDLMGGAFKVLGGCSAGGMFSGISNPVAGLMVGILATVLVQSSSTSTSIVVSLVGAGSMDVRTAIPVIMGANIGTSVTNTLVSMGQANDPKQFERAFAGATVHDMFNFLTVIVLLPIEAATGLIYHITLPMTPTSVSSGDKWVGPIKVLVGPLVKLFLSVDKKVIEKVALGDTTCDATYAAVTAGTKKYGLVKGGFLQGAGTMEGDMAAGGVALFISLFLLCLGLYLLVKLLQSMVLGTSERMLRKATDMNSYLAILVGLGITILVQSSSVTTSVLTPLVGVGVLPLEKMLPLTLGANIGTTFTAMLASLVSSKPEAVQVALCHLFFNLIGIAIWFPIPIMRRVPLRAAKGLGSFTRRYRVFPVIYILFCFVIAPVVLLFTSSLLVEDEPAYKLLGSLLVIAIVGLVGYFLVWWNKMGGRATFFGYLEKRQHRSEFNKDLPQQYARVVQRLEEVEKLLKIKVDDNAPAAFELKAIKNASEGKKDIKKNQVSPAPSPPRSNSPLI